MNPPRATTEVTLPFERLSPDQFERLCRALLAAEDHSSIRHWGAAGSEKGCDLVSVAPDGRPTVTQCKRVKELGPTGAEAELRKVLGDPPSPAPQVYALIATCALSRDTEERLEKVAGETLEIEMCGLTDLDGRVRKHRDLVELYFGPVHSHVTEGPTWWLSAAPADRTWTRPSARTWKMPCDGPIPRRSSNP